MLIFSAVTTELQQLTLIYHSLCMNNFIIQIVQLSTSMKDNFMWFKSKICKTGPDLSSGLSSDRSVSIRIGWNQAQLLQSFIRCFLREQKICPSLPPFASALRTFAGHSLLLVISRRLVYLRSTYRSMLRQVHIGRYEAVSKSLSRRIKIYE